MDTETRRYVNEYKNQLEYLRMIIFNLDQKLQARELTQSESCQLRDEVDKSNTAREELRKSLLETTQDLREESGKFNKVISELECHNRDILGSLRESHSLIDNLQGDIHRNEIRISHLENENSELKLKSKSAATFKAQLTASRNEHEQAERRNIESLQNITNKVNDLEAMANKLSAERAAMQETKKDSELMNAQLRTELVAERENSTILTNELDNLKRKLHITESSVHILQSVSEQRDNILKDLNKIRSQHDGVLLQIETMEKDLLEKGRDLDMAESRAKDNASKLNSKARNLEEHLNTSRSENNSLKKDNIELKNHIITLEQLLCVKEDVYSQLQNSNDRLNVRTDDCDKLKGQLEAATKVGEQQEEKIFELEKCLIYLKNVLQDKDEYQMNLKRLLIELKDKSQVYVPLQDEIDLRLGEFINTSSDPKKLTRMFLREGQGVYTFGTKRVFVKMENGKIFIRVGGGF